MTNPTDRYIHAATRENTRKSYRAAIEHYESVWGGYLPATADSVAQYLAHYAPTLAINTLKLRLAGLAAWHNDQGFPDPTKSPHVKKVLKGITELHPHTETQAKPLKLEDLNRVVSWFDEVLRSELCTRPRRLTLVRNKALFLIGFWRAFRSDDLTRINIENVSVVPEKGLEIFLPRSKTDRSAQGRVVRVPALLQLCPVSAYLDWVSEAQLREGPLFPGINRWGHLSEKSLHPASVITIIKQSCTLAGIPDADEYSSHSLRRGFAGWSNTQQWDIKALMEYVGWKDAKTALKYIEADDPFLSQNNKRGLNLPDSNM